MDIYIAPWEWRIGDDESYWDAPRPDICIGRLDLRSLPKCRFPSEGGGGFGLFAYSENPGNVGYNLNDNWDRLITNPQKRAIASALDYGESFVASTPRGMLVEMFTKGADATGLVRWKPRRGSLKHPPRISIGGQEIWRGNLSDVFDNTIVAFRVEYAEMKAAGLDRVRLAKAVGARMLSLWGRCGDDLLEPLLGTVSVDDYWRYPTTSWADSFDREIDVADIGNEADWTLYHVEWATVIQIVAAEDYAKCLGDGGGNAVSYRADHAMSDDALYVQCDMYLSSSDATRGPGLVLRKDSSATITNYRVRFGFSTSAPQIHLRRFVAGAPTDIQTTFPGYSMGVGSWAACYYEIDSSDNHTVKVNGSTVLTDDDNIVSGATYSYGGLYTLTNNYHNYYNNFEVGDLSAGYLPHYVTLNDVPTKRISKTFFEN